MSADGLARTEPPAPRVSLLQESLSIKAKGCENNEYVTFISPLLFSWAILFNFFCFLSWKVVPIIEVSVVKT